MKLKNIYKVLPMLVFFAVGLFLMAKPILDMDELWNYGFASYINEGMVPYRDFNMIQTPGSAYLAAGFLAVFGNSLSAFRLLSGLLFGLTFGLLFTLCRRISNNGTLAFVSTSFVSAISFLVWIYNYNHLNVLLLLVILYLEYCQETNAQEKSRILHTLIGLTSGITFIVKQSTGVFLICGCVVLGMIRILMYKENWETLLWRLLGATVPAMILCICLLLSGSFPMFIDYAVAGVQTFVHTNTWFAYILQGPIDFGLGIFPLVVTALSVWTIIQGKSRVSCRFHVSALLLSWFGASVAFPICDFVHISAAVIPFLVPLLCCAGGVRILSREKIICCLVAAVVLVCPLYKCIKDCTGCIKSELPYYKGLPINPHIENQIKTIETYIRSL